METTMQQKMQELSRKVYDMSNNFYHIDIRDVNRNYDGFRVFNNTYTSLVELFNEYFDILTETEQEVFAGCIDNAESAYSSIFSDFKLKYNKCGNNAYHTEEENFNSALEFASLIKRDYNFDLIEFLTAKVLI